MREPADHSRSSQPGLDGYTPIWDAERTVHQQNYERDDVIMGWAADTRSIWRRLAEVAAQAAIGAIVLAAGIAVLMLVAK